MHAGWLAGGQLKGGFCQWSVVSCPWSVAEKRGRMLLRQQQLTTDN
ncbi:hypothetical protein PLANPX_2603 [Lacipirellula parvula]|uniref:Uncharacterized protein n=1 Tax=Lacipirellula parvula TaxID=2650471 RepID=A0A5K7XDR7_9BACT|nr:hypothetical protein PLANPX_2603 [Lacipirellula parvula]